MLRVITIGSVSPAKGGTTSGGVATHHSSMIQIFTDNPQLGVEIVCVIATNSTEHVDSDTGIPYEMLNGGETRTQCLNRVISKYIPDCLIVHHIAHAWASAIEGIERKPMIVGYVHSWNPIDPIHDPNHAVKRGHLDKSLPHFDLLVFGSPHSLERSSKFGIQFSSEIAVIPPAISDVFITGTQSIEDSDGEYGLFIGRLDDNKNIEQLIEAIQEVHDDLRLKIIGDGPLREEIQAQLDLKGEQCRCELLGWMSPVDFLPILQNADFLCVPSNYESFGMVYVEALCSGVPVIGYAPSIDFIEQQLGLRCGIGLANQSAEHIMYAIQEIKSIGFDKEKVGEKARRVFSPYELTKALAEEIMSVFDSQSF